MGSLIRKGFFYLLIISFITSLSLPLTVHADVTGTTASAATPLKKIALVGGDVSTKGSQIQSIIKNRLQNEPYEIVEYTGAQLSDRTLINKNNIDLIIWSGADTYPVDSVSAVTAYLKEGGELIALGAPALTKPAKFIDGRWQSEDEIDTALKQQQTAAFLDFETEDQRTGWERSTNDFSVPGSVTFPQDNGSAVMHYDTANYTSWDTYIHTISPGPADSAIVFKAKGDPQTKQLAFEIREADNSRWIAALELTGEWDSYILRPSDFRCWQCSAQNRGGPNDFVKFSNAAVINIGLAVSFTNGVSVGTAHQFSIDNIGWIHDPLAENGQINKFEVMDGLTPEWKYFPVGDSSQVHAAPSQSIIPEPQQLTLNKIDASVYPRPSGTGYKKLRTQRFVPLLETYDSKGQRSGYAAWMMINSGKNYVFSSATPPTKIDNPYSGSVWTVFSVSDPVAYQQPELTDAVVRTVKAMLPNTYLIEGGSEKFAYMAGQNAVKLGASVALFNSDPVTGLEVEWKVVRPDGSTAYQETRSLGSFPQITNRPGGIYTDAELIWNANLVPGVYKVTTTLRNAGTEIDKLEHELNVWASKPEAQRNYVGVKDGHFTLNGQPWFAYGLNYMPESGLGQENSDLYEHYLSAASYDPALIDEDLNRIHELGFNMVSAFIYYDELQNMNLLDFLARAEKYGLKVNLGIRNLAEPKRFSPGQVRDIVTTYKLSENDTMFAYDIAWENEWGNYYPNSPNIFGRPLYDADWEKWVVEQYGSIANAEADWGVPIPRKNNGQFVTGPSNDQLNNDGPHRTMVAAYRRFADDFTARMHTDVASYLKSIDPFHYVSFRMNTSGDPTAPPERMGYDFKGLASSMDFMAPEGYGRTTDTVTGGMFTVSDSRYAAPNRPVIWSEAGASVWNKATRTYFKDNDTLLQNQKSYYERFYEMLQRSQADGIAFWWYAGGFRYNENSDLGILNPDGSDRPVTPVIREYAAILKAMKTNPPAPKPDVVFPMDRDQSSTGLKGIYDQLKGPYWDAVLNGSNPVLTDAGRTTTSADTPLIAVGNTPYNGNNPLKYLNSFFKRAELSIGDGKWFEVKDGMQITVPQGSPVKLRTHIVNTESATWLAPGLHSDSTGTVSLSSMPDSELQVNLPITTDTAYQQEALIGDSLLTPSVAGKTKVALRMQAKDRAAFGAKLAFTIEPGNVTAPVVGLPVDSGDNLNGWFGDKTTLSLDTQDKTEGSASLSGMYNTGSPVVISMIKRFARPFITGATGSTGSNASNGSLELDLYISDVTQITSGSKIQFSSIQIDQNEFVWYLKSPNLHNGWNHLTLRFNQAQVNGFSDPNGLRVIRILTPLVTPISGSPTIVKADNILLRNPAYIVPLDKTLLNYWIAKGEQLNSADYTTANWQAIQQALQHAKIVQANANADQTEVDSAASALEAAIIVTKVTGVKLSANQVVFNSVTESVYQLTANFIPSNASDQTVTWSSDNPSVVTVDQTGKLSAVSDGSAAVTVTTSDGGFQDVANVIVDTLPPVTKDDAKADWQNTDQIITLTASDTTSGVEKTVYSVDDGPFVEGSRIVIDTEGIHMIRYYSFDKAGNQENAKTVQVKIDKTPPAIQISVAPSGSASTNVTQAVYLSDWIQVKATVSDTLSGMMNSDIKLDNAGVSPTFELKPLTLSIGQHTIDAAAADHAGNTSSQQLVFDVKMDVSHLKPVLQYAKDQGWIKNQGIYTSMVEIADSIQQQTNKSEVLKRLTDLENIVKAQSGKYIDTAFAQKMLTEIIPYLKSLYVN
jgi:uncharacterized protein YjdB